MTAKKNIPPPPTPNRDFTAAAREEVLKRVEQDYEEFKKIFPDLEVKHFIKKPIPIKHLVATINNTLKK